MEPDPSDRSTLLASFSTWLVRERELRGLSRGDVLRSTRLAPAVVEALESGDPSRLPPRAYVLGYLRSYAAAVGLDADDVVLRFEEAVGPGGSGTGRRRRRAVPWVAATALAVAVAGAVWAWLRW